MPDSRQAYKQVMGNLKKLQNGKQNNFRTYIEIYEIVDGN
jgi:hypothetical protein